MLNNSPFYFQLVTKYVSYFGSLFNDLYITRDDPSDGEPNQLIKVPVSYASKDRILVRVDADPEINKTSAITLPRMSFQMTGMQYDADRKLQSTGRMVRKGDTANKMKMQYNPVPYNLNFELGVYAKNVEDGLRVVEQIVPFFTPELTATLNLIEDMDEIIDIPIVLNSIDFDDRFMGDFKSERRSTVWTLNFTLKGYLYGPVRQKPIIKFSFQDLYIDSFDNELAGQIEVQPGLTANGEPTDDINLTVDANTIWVTDNYGFITTYIK